MAHGTVVTAKKKNGRTVQEYNKRPALKITKIIKKIF
jgi:hypothetical protein